jgi:hypothetical protein
MLPPAQTALGSLVLADDASDAHRLRPGRAAAAVAVSYFLRYTLKRLLSPVANARKN